MYGGAQGIWVGKTTTGHLAANGVVFGLLHTGRHYPDDVSEDGLIYHYPRTSRPSSRDAAEVEATKNANRLGLPVFIILPGETNQTRCVRLGWIEDWDDEAALFLVLFGDTAPIYSPPAEQDEPFSLTDHAPMKMAMVKVRGRQQVFDSKSFRNMEPSVRFARSRIRTCSRRPTFEANAKRGLTTGEMAFPYAPPTMTPTTLNCLPFIPIRFRLSQHRTLIPLTSDLLEMRSR